MTASTTAKKPVPDLRHCLRSLTCSCTIITFNNFIPCRFFLIPIFHYIFLGKELILNLSRFDCDTHPKLIKGDGIQVPQLPPIFADITKSYDE
jgi:hypothetical protein